MTRQGVFPSRQDLLVILGVLAFTALGVHGVVAKNYLILEILGVCLFFFMVGGSLYWWWKQFQKKGKENA